MPGSSLELEDRIAAVRRFSRFYTRQLGMLREGLNETPFSLAEARVLYELAHRDHLTATGLGADLGLDQGYLSRILRRFGEEGLLAKKRAADDARQHLIAITAKGRKAFAPLNRNSRDQVAAMLGRLSPSDQERLVAAMGAIERLLDPGAAAEKRPYVLRPHRVGDMGWVISAHGALYAQEYGWDITFEALVAKVAAEFIENLDPKREHCWIAEVDGKPVGSAFVVRKTDAIAKLRLVIVHPKARGLGIGKRLVEESLRFAKAAGYSSMTLWTQSILVAARGIYQNAGFRLVAEDPHHSFGVDLVGETWERDL
jgi:DNA-binding MarR family transcriptional regulator/GNAT superfamily N-acetyltransferase